MPNLPKCDDLISPTLEIDHDKLAKMLAAGIGQVRPQEVLDEYLETDEAKKKAKKYSDYARELFSMTKGAKIREKYNRKILEVKKSGDDKITKADASIYEAQRRSDESTRRTEQYRDELAKDVREYRAKIKDVLGNAISNSLYSEKQQRQTWPGFFTGIRKKYYLWRGYDPEIAKKELSILKSDISARKDN